MLIVGATSLQFKNLININSLKEYSLIKGEYDILIARMEPENNIDMILEGYMNSNMDRIFLVLGNMNTKFGRYIKSKYNDEKIKYFGFISGIDKLDYLRYFSNLLRV